MSLSYRLKLKNKTRSAIATYTIDASYITPIPTTQTAIVFRSVSAGQVVALNPQTGMVIPSYPSFSAYTSAYEFSGVVGPVYRSMRAGTRETPINRAVSVVVGGVVDPLDCIDDGVVGVLEATKAALAGRVSFLSEAE